MNTIPDNIDFQTWYDLMEPAVKIRPARDIVREAIALLQADPPAPVVMPWQKLKDMFSFRAGEVTVYAGQNGSGKSMITTMIALQLMAQKRNVLIASFEMKPTTTLQRMVRQFATRSFRRLRITSGLQLGREITCGFMTGKVKLAGSR